MTDTLVEAKELIGKYSVAEVAKHNTSEDCWLIIKGRVYDVTNFLDDHPGGPSVLADAAGTDATEQFERVGHPESVQKTMNKYHIGVIESANNNSESSATTATSELLVENEKKVFEKKKNGWESFRDWTDRNPFVWYVVASGIVLMVAWIAAGFGEKAGYGGRFEIVGFIPNVTAYAYRLKDPTTWQLIAPWVGYAPHQVLHFYFVYRAQAAAPAYSDEWRWFNWDMFKLNFFFVAVKFTFSHFFYNGLSAVLPLWFGVGTVAVMLMVVIVIRLPVRGLFFGQGRTKFLHPKLLMKELADFVKKYHGYYISFALINDFWYHPFEATPGHMLGLFNDLLLLWQSSALYHRSHRNKYWTLLLETIVLLHSGIIAIPRDTFLAETAGRTKGIASMFAFGYALIFVVTQMWDLGNTVAARWVIRALCLASFVTAFVLYYVLSNVYRDMWEIIRIPLIEYGIVIFFIFAFAGLARVVWKGTKKDSLGRIFLTSFFTVICLAVPFAILSFILNSI